MSNERTEGSKLSDHLRGEAELFHKIILLARDQRKLFLLVRQALFQPRRPALQRLRFSSSICGQAPTLMCQIRPCDPWLRLPAPLVFVPSSLDSVRQAVSLFRRTVRQIWCVNSKSVS